jgi:uncharacterized protein YkwD
MLRTLAVSFAIATLAVSPGLCAAQANPPAAEFPNHDASNKQPNPQSNSAAGSSSGEDSAAENELLQAANQSRERAGVPPLRMDETLREAARAHAQQMVANERLDHQFSGEPSLVNRIAQVSLLPPNDALKSGAPKSDALKIDRAGENVAYAPCPPDVHEALMRSAPHRHNLLDQGFNVAGVAAIWSQGKLYVVQDFAHQIPSYSAEQSDNLVGRAVSEIRQQAGLPDLAQLKPASLDEAACSLAKESRPNAHLLATAYDNRKMITYTESHPEVLPQAAVNMLHDPGVRQFAVGACYARNAAYPTGTYWVAILLY